MSALSAMRVAFEAIPADNTGAIEALLEGRRQTLQSIEDLRLVSAELQNRKVNHGRDTSPTLIAWADRIDAAIIRLGRSA